jgi:fibronectin type 3 domain-containing protein
VSTAAYTDNTVQSGQTYYYWVTAVNSSGVESAYSNSVSAAIP